MKIAVCIKRVPDMEMRFSIAGDRKSLDPSGLKYELGDFDGYALEVGLQLVEKQGPGEVVVLSVGPDGVQETLRKGLAMGAARAVQLKADEVPFDGLAIAQALAGATEIPAARRSAGAGRRSRSDRCRATPSRHRYQGLGACLAQPPVAHGSSVTRPPCR